MENRDRRGFLKKFAAGIAGTAALTSFDFPEPHSRIQNRATQNDESFWEDVKKQFPFAPDIRYFNNASLGACPQYVQESTNAFRATLDGFPSKYMWGDWADEKEATRKLLADLFFVSPEEIALIHNTTEGVNLIAKSFDLKEGDEVILADHEHSSGTIPWQVWQESKGVKLVRPELPLMPQSVDEIVEVYRKAITPKTRIISMCHIVNTNGMMLPVKEVSEMAREMGILVSVDGAQGAGMYQFDLNELGCDFYMASAHKWLFAPKGVGMLYARKENQDRLKPLVVARGHTDKSIRRLENYNTRNLPEVLGMGSAVEFINDIGHTKIHNRTFELKHYFREKLAGNPKLKLKTPASDDLSGSIQVVEVVGRNVGEVRSALLEKHGIDCRPMSGFGLNALRLSFAIYITKKDIDDLVRILETI